MTADDGSGLFRAGAGPSACGPRRCRYSAALRHKQGDQLTGFSIDLWNEIAARLKLTTNYQAVSDAGTLLASLRTKNADVIVSGLFYSTERDREFDFSYPIMKAGLQVTLLQRER